MTKGTYVKACARTYPPSLSLIPCCSRPRAFCSPAAASDDFALANAADSDAKRGGAGSGALASSSRGFSEAVVRQERELASRRPRSRLEPKGKTDADVALEALVGHEIYVYGTGTAREMRQDGVLRKVQAEAWGQHRAAQIARAQCAKLIAGCMHRSETRCVSSRGGR
jgi:hypothetical protein